MVVEGSSSSMSKISLNASALTLVKRLCDEAEKYAVAVEETESGATLIDAGIDAEGGFLAGEIITKICLGGYGTAKLLPIQYGDIVLPSIFVQTDHPTLQLWHLSLLVGESKFMNRTRYSQPSHPVQRGL